MFFVTMHTDRGAEKDEYKQEDHVLVIIFRIDH